MFSKAKLKRFNESVGCAPPPTKYNTNVEQKIQNIVFEKSDRFIDGKENTPGPNAYMGIKVVSVKTPRKKVLSIPKLNISQSSTNSASSHGGFLSPPSNFIRSKSLRSTKQKDVTYSDLQNKVQELICERDTLHGKITELEERMLSSKLDSVTISDEKILCESSTQVNESLNTKDLIEEETGRSSTPNTISVTMEQYQLMKDELEHLTLLRNNLENSIANKEDLIADLHNQVDIMVDEAQEYQNSSIYYKEEVEKLLEQLDRTAEERKVSESKVTSLIARYEAIINRHSTDEQIYNKNMAAKELKIEILNDSISILNAKVSQIGTQLAQIPNLEMKIGDLSWESKEKEVIETLLQYELDERHNQVIKLEESILGIEKKAGEAQKERDELEQLTKDMHSELEVLRVQAKEREVLQHFLEKEIASREAEINEYSLRIQSLESDFESTQQLAMDLQQDAETQLNQLFCLKASLSAKEYDIEAKDDMIDDLKEQISKKCQDNNSNHNDSKSGKLEEELHGAREFMRSALENTSQLEEKVIQLLADIGERDEMHKKQILEKDSELEELSVKYSDALLEQDAVKRILNHTSQELEKENMIIQATDLELKMVKSEFKNKVEQNKQFELAVKEVNLKLTHVEDALACEEAESRVLQDKLQEKIASIQECLQATKEELESVTSSNTGFMSQITQLRIDMHRKCCAVDEMQGCIDALRQEKSELCSSYSEIKNSFNDKETLLSDLQNEFEGKLKTITELQDQIGDKDDKIMGQNDLIQNLSTQVLSLNLDKKEAETVFNATIATVKLNFRKEQQMRMALEAKAEEIHDDLCSLKDEKDKVIEDISSSLSEKETKISELESNLRELEAKYEVYDDQIKNLQISLTEKTSEVDRFDRSRNEINLAVECQQESSFQLKSHLKKLEEDQDFLNQSLQQKDQMLADLNHSMLLKSDELHELQKEINKKEEKINSLEEALVTVRQKLESSSSQLESDHEKIIEIGDILQEKQENESSLRDQMDKLREELDNLRLDQNLRESDDQEVITSLQEEADFWKNKFDHLENLIEPFKEQLNAYDQERTLLVSESSAAQHEMDKLSREYAALLGHTNHKQKIHHVVKLKEENSTLKKEVLKMRHDIDSLRQAHRKLEEQTGARRKTTYPSQRRDNKENTGHCAQDQNPVLSPLRSSNKYNRI